MTNVALAPVPFGYIPGAAGVDLTPTDWTAAGAGVTSVTFPNGGNVVLAINNGSASPLAITPVLARGVQGQTPTVPAYSLAAGKVQGYGPFPVKDFGSTVTVNFTGAASITVQAFEMTSA